MSAIAINDLNTGQDLDRNAMMSLIGGSEWHYLGSSYSWGSWNKISESSTFLGIAWHDGFFKRKFRVRMTYRQVNYRSDYYDRYRSLFA